MTIQNFDWVYFWETANYLSWYEYLVLICFGAGWWSSVRNSLKTRQVAGKSNLFLWLIIIGSCCGICHHLFVDLNFKIVFYILILSGALSDYCVCRRLRFEQRVKERKKIIAERDFSYGVDIREESSDNRRYKSSDRGGHRRRSGSDERRHSRHKCGSHKLSTKAPEESLENKNDVIVGSSIKEIEFDNINE